MTTPKSYAVMAQRVEAPDSLDFFPTPPWATRALIEDVIDPKAVQGLTCWEPAAGQGHMAEALRPYFVRLHASDVHDYGCDYDVGSFVGGGLSGDLACCPFPPDWIITNPPFNLAGAFLKRALATAERGVALLLRTAWIEGETRYNEIFSKTAPTTIAQFAERVPMVKGRWDDPNASSATAYMWFVWERRLDARNGYNRHGSSELVWIPPGAKRRHACSNDVTRFARDD